MRSAPSTRPAFARVGHTTQAIHKQVHTMLIDKSQNTDGTAANGFVNRRGCFHLFVTWRQPLIAPCERAGSSSFAGCPFRCPTERQRCYDGQSKSENTSRPSYWRKESRVLPQQSFAAQMRAMPVRQNGQTEKQRGKMGSRTRELDTININFESTSTSSLEQGRWKRVKRACRKPLECHVFPQRWCLCQVQQTTQRKKGRIEHRS